MTELIVRLLGQPQFSVGASPIACPSQKSLGLFAFVLLTGKVHSRRELATLLWGQSDEESARASLRSALHRLPAAMSECLRVDRASIGVAVSATPLVDVVRFEQLSHAEDLDSLETAATLYRDELLKDFEPDATPEFDDWLHAERVRLGQLAQRVFDGVITQRTDRARRDPARATSERESALAIGLRWISLMPASEAGHLWVMRLYIDMGRRDAALAQYELCKRSLAVAHGRTPSPETRALHERALGGGASSLDTRAPADRRRNPGFDAVVDRAGIAATSFVGRLEELANLDRLFADPACRLITLHGLGGTGKTRLAHAFATNIGPRFAQGVSWVALETADSPDGLPAAIAEAMGHEVPPRGDRVSFVAGMLEPQQRLLVLDNFESLLGGNGATADADPAAVVLKILETAPHVRIVVTSREVLGLPEEWVFDVRGLAYAASESAPPAQGNVPAVELFAQRARQAYRGFSIADEMPDVLRICRIIEGLPLGIELAAAWVRTIPCADIAAAIELEAVTLSSVHRNRPGRHQSLEAVIACSWKLLDNEQSSALAALGVFVGGFTSDAAERIAEATLRTLSVLTDKALVRRRAEGRYDLHELVRHFALSRLRKMRTRHALTTNRHGDFFAMLLVRLIEDLRGPAEAAADALMRSELANILAAWRRSVESARLDLVERMAAAVVALLYARGTLPAALAEAERAINALANSQRADVIGAVRMEWGRAAIGLDPAVARRELEAALSQARRDGERDHIARCLYYAGSFDYKQGNIDAAKARAEEAFALAADSRNAELRTVVHYLCGEVANARSQFDLAEALTRKALAAARERGSPALIGGMLISLGGALYYQGKFTESRALTTEAAQLYETIGRHTVAIAVRNNLAGIALAQGDIPAARENGDIAIHLAREAGDEQQLAWGLANLGDILIRTGDLGQARVTLVECLQLAESVKQPRTATEALYLLASIDIAEQRGAAALAHILRLRDALTEHRLDLRIPLLVLAAAEWLLAMAIESRNDAMRWLEALGRLEDIDATLRDKARQLLVREGATAGDDAHDHMADLSLPELEREVAAFLAGMTQDPNKAQR